MLAAEGNIRVANLTTPAQYFHLLRRQARVAKQRPLVIMTPKSLLRLPQATSRIEHLVASRASSPCCAEPRIDEEKVERLVLCTGKIYYDLKGHATREDNEGVAISPRRAAVPVPAAADHGGGRALPEPARGRVGAGGAAQHGRPRAHVAAPAADPARARSSSATSAGPSAPRRARATRPPTPSSRTGSSAPRWTSRSRSRSTRPSSPASAERRPGLTPRCSASIPGGGTATAAGSACRRLQTVVPQGGTLQVPRIASPAATRSSRALILAIGIPSAAVGFGEGRSAAARQAQPEPRRAQALTRRDRDHRQQLDLRHPPVQQEDGDGGGAIYGCRSNPGNEPCIRANNLKGGRAFEFETVGKEAGPHRGRRRHRRAVHDQRDRRGHGPERRQGRRQGRDRLRRGGRPAVRRA